MAYACVLSTYIFFLFYYLISYYETMVKKYWNLFLVLIILIVNREPYSMTFLHEGDITNYRCKNHILNTKLKRDTSVTLINNN